MTPRLLRHTGFGFVVAVLSVFGCNGIGCEGCGGSGKFPTHPVTVPDASAPVGDGGVSVKGGFNNCPTASLEVAPTMVRVGQSLRATANASDLDPNDANLIYKWTATSGFFGEDGEPEATFTCDTAGPVTITLAVSDGSCVTTATAPVFCVAIRDGGAEGGAGGGGTGTGGSGGGGGGGGLVNTCPAAEPTRGTPACPTCVMGNCALGTGPGAVDGCCGLASEADQLLCQALYACFSANAATCTSGGNPTVCFCGTAPTASTCWAVQGAANGPCVNQAYAAGKTADPVALQQRFISPMFPVGRAVNLMACQGSLCPTECALP